MADTKTAYMITVLWNSGADHFSIAHLSYGAGEEATAWAAYDALCAIPAMVTVTLEGVDGTRASWDRTPLVEGVE
jgi:hypothetical protein